MFETRKDGKRRAPTPWAATVLIMITAQYAPDIEKAKQRALSVLVAHETIIGMVHVIQTQSQPTFAA